MKKWATLPQLCASCFQLTKEQWKLMKLMIEQAVRWLPELHHEANAQHVKHRQLKKSGYKHKS
jgi:hypothetical protein